MLKTHQLESIFGPIEALQELDFKDAWLSISIDSRTILPGDIFFAIKGESFDGHDFVASALENGAIFAVVQTDWALKNTAEFKKKLLPVPDPLQAFGTLARFHLARIDTAKIAITGSSGKTSTKEMVKALLLELLGAEKVYASSKNFNNHVGLPLSVFQVKFTHRASVFEMGMNHAGEIAYLCTIVRPDYGIITNIGHAHEGNFAEGIVGVAKAKAELLDGLGAEGHAVVNADDALLMAEVNRRLLSGITTFGLSEKADVRLLDRTAFDETKGRQEVTVCVDGIDHIFSLPLAGAHQALNAVAALALVKAMGLPIEKALPGFEKMTISDSRMQAKRAPKGFLVIDDGYNANPNSMGEGIKASREFKASRRIAVIGAMGELGPSSEQHHYELGQKLAKEFDYVFICGHNAKPAVLGAKERGMALSQITFGESSAELIAPLLALVKADDVIFVKGSLSANMAVITEALMQG